MHATPFRLLALALLALFGALVLAWLGASEAERSAEEPAVARVAGAAEPREPAAGLRRAISAPEERRAEPGTEAAPATPSEDAPAMLAGRVVFESGEAAVGAPLTAWRMGGRNEPRLTAASDERGCFRIDVPVDLRDEGRKWIVTTRVGVASGSAANLRLPVEGVEILLPTLGEVGLRVVELGSGEELPLASLSWRRAGDEQWRSTAGVESGPDGVHRVRAPVGLVDFQATTRTGRHFAGELLNVLVATGSAMVWEIELERGIELVVQFSSLAGESEYPLGGPAFLYEKDGGRISVERVGPGRALYAPVRPGAYSVVDDEAFAFSPAVVEVGDAPHQELDVSWRITDMEAFEALEESYAELEEAARAGLMGPGDAL